MTVLESARIEEHGQGLFPSLVAPQVVQGVSDYLHTTFAFSDPALSQALNDLLERADGLFKGPYISLRLPYRKPDDDAPAVPLEIGPVFRPYIHQVRAWERLSSLGGRTPKHTLVTTGTSSGKTECFLFPVLDHCYRNHTEKGIKAIVLYPMNALATDQAGRLARAIWSDPRLRGRIRAGLYVGDSGESSSDRGSTLKQTREMTEESLITDRRVLRENPPDILLTNYRMLDFLLLRPKDRTLWDKNTAETLRYLVLDEVHTYDGAQGSDVACLIRRVRRRLGLAPETPGFTCIGTSATVVGEADPSRAAPPGRSLLDFASQLFGVPFPEDAVIGEERIPSSEFTAGELVEHPYPRVVDELRPRPGERFNAYAVRQTSLWFGEEARDPSDVGDRIRRHSLFGSIVAQLGGKARSERELIERLVFDASFEALPEDARLPALRAFLALVAWSRRRQGAKIEPLVALTIHVWMRELRRLVRVVDERPRFRFDSDAVKEDRQALPAYYCRECGHSGWLTSQHRGDNHYSHDLREIYRAYFEHSDEVRYLSLGSDEGVLPGTARRLDPTTLTEVDDVEVQGVPTIPIRAHIHVSERNQRDTRTCPACEASDSLTFAGAQGATLGSVAVNQLFGTRLALDKKLLAFTDSVQDASHLAGFFTGRTFRFNLRAAFMQPLMADNVTSIPLTSLADRTLALVDDALGVQRSTAELWAPDLSREPAYRAFMDASSDARSPNLQRLLRDRLDFEALLEFGYSARVGRTLTKVGCATLVFDEEKLRRAAKGIGYLVEGDSPELFGRDRTSTDSARQLVLGLLHRLAWRGGISHPWLTTYAREKGDRYLLSKKRNRHIAPMFLSRRAPVFATLEPKSRFFESWVPTDRWTFISDWAVRCLGATVADGRLGAELIHRLRGAYQHVARILVEVGLLTELGQHDRECLGIDPTALSVTSDVRLLRCSSPSCGHTMTLAPSEAASFIEHPCVRFRCRGHYAEDLRQGQVFYRTLYTTGDLKRVFGAEHTGLLHRSERERTETAFRAGVPHDAPNLLTCTPTLEMGIDIGDLSATLLAGVPPAVASFVQRAGRSGRSTGNSLVVTQARTRPQDLYFFDEPLDMVAGTVVAPGMFLNAPEMLIRQLIAFSLDEWGRQTPNAALPRNVADLLSAAKAKRFPDPYLDFIDANREALLDGFFVMFKDLLPENRIRLREAVDGLRERLGNEIEATRSRVEELRTLRTRLAERLKKLEDDLTRSAEEKAADAHDFRQDVFQIEGRIKKINATYGLDWFVDHGFLPNYALSEPGVTLNAVITGVPAPIAKDDGTTELRETFEEHSWRRPASMAIREFAPFNTFYASGRRVEVDRVSVGTRTRSTIERWVFCAHCSFAVPEQTVEGQTECPDCKAMGLGEQGQRRDVVRLTEVSARVPHNDSQSLDATDERERESYRIIPFFRVDPKSDRRAFADEERGFGYEWLSRVELREINLGLYRRSDLRLRVHGEFTEAPGFQVCDDCGVVVDTRDTHDDAKSRVRHLSRCRTRRASKTETSEWRDVLLYRETASEAIRILLPVAVDAERRLANFKAALHLGLRLKFGGSPVHLVVRAVSEPTEGSVRRHFLYLYDNVPGGTGYLNAISKTPEELLELFELALQRLRACTCTRAGQTVTGDEGDGCYRCLFSRESIDDLKHLSKRETVELLADLLGRTSLKAMATLSNVSVAKLAESELELLFLRKFAEAAEARGFVTSPTTEGGWVVHTFRRGKERMRLRPQVDLGAQQGVEIASRPDFLLEVTRDPDGKPVTRKPIAVFCDGYSIHAQQESGASLIADDVAKRTAILRSGRYRVWSITWDDLERKDFEKPLFPYLHRSASEQAFDVTVKSLFEVQKLTGLLGLGSVIQLFHLALLDDDAWPKVAAAFWRAAVLKPPLRVGDDAWQAVTPSTTALNTDAAGEWVAAWSAWPQTSLAMATRETALTTNGSAYKKNPGPFTRWVLSLVDDAESRGGPEFRRAWQRFLALLNLLQAADGCVQSMQSLDGGADGRTLAETIAGSADWVDEIDPALRTFANRFVEDGVPAPEVLSDLPPEGALWGQAEFAWPSAKLAVLHPAFAADFDVVAARAADWVVVTAASEVDVADLLARLRRTA